MSRIILNENQIETVIKYLKSKGEIGIYYNTTDPDSKKKLLKFGTLSYKEAVRSDLKDPKIKRIFKLAYFKIARKFSQTRL